MKTMQTDLLVRACYFLIAVVADLRKAGMKQLQWASINRHAVHLVKYIARARGSHQSEREQCVSLSGRMIDAQPTMSPAAFRYATDFVIQLRSHMESTPAWFQGLSLVQSAMACIAEALVGYCNKTRRSQFETVNAISMAQRCGMWLKPNTAV